MHREILAYSQEQNPESSKRQERMTLQQRVLDNRNLSNNVLQLAEKNQKSAEDVRRNNVNLDECKLKTSSVTPMSKVAVLKNKLNSRVY